MAETFLMW